MSRVDEALRRAALDPAGIHAPVGLPAAAVPIDESELDRYAAEKPSPSPGLAPAPEPAPQSGVPRTARPQAPQPYRLEVFQSSLEGKLVISREASSVSVEQYRRLATTLHAAQSERGLKSLMVSSALPGEGKTLTVVNLALTFSESYGRRVLLIDADLRRPCIHELFGVPNGVGLGDALRSDDAQLRSIQVSPTLSILPGGAADRSPMAALSSDRMRSLVADSASRFDWVLLDSPPIGLLSDAHLVARACDGVLFVIGAGATPYHLVQRSIAELGAERIVGTVLNRADAQVLTGYDYYGRYSSRR